MKRRLLVRLLVYPAVIYAGVVGLLLFFEDSLVYQSDGPEALTAPGSLVREEVTFPSASGKDVYAWWCPREGADEVFLFFHGQTGNLSYRAGFAERLQTLNRSVLMVEYPGYGKCEGPSCEQACYDAADAAYDWLIETKGYSSRQIIPVGKSLGGGIAVDLASRRPCGAVVLIKTFTSVPDVGGRMFPFVPARLLMKNRFDNLSKIGDVDCPVFLAAGGDDWRIPPAQSEKLYDEVRGRKKLVVMPGVGHNGPALTAEGMGELKEFLGGKKGE